MSKLIEILGRGMEVDITELIWQWMETVRLYDSEDKKSQFDRLDKVVELVGKKMPDSAANQLRPYLFEYPQCTRARMAAAGLYLLNNQLNEAIVELNSVYMREPNNTMALFALGHCYERMDSDSQAIEFYQDCLKFKNYLQLPRQRLAAIYFKKGQLEKTIFEYEQLRIEYPDDNVTLVLLGYLYMANMKYAEAVDVFNSAILMYPDNFQSKRDEIDEMLDEGRFDEALEAIDDRLEDHCEDIVWLARRGDVLGMTGSTEESIAQCEQVLRLCPDFLEVRIKLGTQYLLQHRNEEAAMMFNRAIEINDRIVEAYIGLSAAQNLSGNYPEAVRVFSLAAAIQPNSSLLFAEMANLQYKINVCGSDHHGELDGGHLLEEVIKAHQKHIALNPHNPDMRYRLGILMLSVGRLSEAAKFFQSALELNPSYIRAELRLAICDFENGLKRQAIDRVCKNNLLTKASIDLHYKTSVLYCDKIKFASSLMNLEQTMQDSFVNTDAPANISIVLQNLGLLDRAEVMWDNLTDTLMHYASVPHRDL